MRFFLLFFILLTLSTGLHAEGLEGKVMCGYQGWFRVPTDGTNTGWHHYSPAKVFEPGACAIELWPDVRELPAEDRVPTGFRHPDGSVAEVFSSVKASTTDLHFKWMRDYGIDGIFLQRFAVTTRDPRYRKPMDTVLEHCRIAAQNNGRCWSLMYDLTGIKPGEIKLVIEDWKRLQEQFQLTDGKNDPTYLRHRGKPLVALWGLGFNDRAPMLDEWRELIRFFKNEATPGGCSVMLGVPTFWRTLNRDAIADPALHELMTLADVISPWTIGRYHSPESAASYVKKTVLEDVDWCRKHQLDYLPVAYPGFSWHNLSASRGEDAPFNAVPRLGGRFFWSQILQFHRAGATMQYIAMFDELDEATAILKWRQDPPTGKNPFLSEPEVPNDHYLWLTGAAGRLLRGELKADTDELPPRGKQE